MTCSQGGCALCVLVVDVLAYMRSVTAEEKPKYPSLERSCPAGVSTPAPDLRPAFPKAAHRAEPRARPKVDFNKIRVYMFLGCGFLLGAGSGAWLSRWFGLYALVVPGCVTGSGGLTYMFFRKHLKEYLERLEQKRLTEDIEQVENILERARSFLDEYQQSQNVGDDNYTMKEVLVASVSVIGLHATWAASHSRLVLSGGMSLGPPAPVPRILTILFSHRLRWSPPW